MTYSLVTSPVGFDFDTMSRAEARQYFDHFVSQIPTRIRMLEEEMRQTPGFESWAADGSDMSVAGLGIWLAETACPREMTEEDYEALRGANPGPLSKVMRQIYPVDLTPETYSLCIDAGMYFGEVLRERHSDVGWRLGPTRPRRGANYNRPTVATLDGEFMWDPASLVFGTVLTFVQLGQTFDLLADLKDLENRVRKRR